jgi:hypothetical protein
MKAAFASLFLILAAPAPLAHAKLLGVSGPFRHPGSGSLYFDLIARVDSSFAANCVQNGGRGVYRTRMKNSYGLNRTPVREFICSNLVLTKAELWSAGLLGAQPQGGGQAYTVDGALGHDYHDNSQDQNPDFINPDRDSSRYATGAYGDDLWFANNWFAPGEFYSDPVFTKGSPVGQDGYFYTILLTCDPRLFPEEVLTPKEVEARCEDSRLLAAAIDVTTGPTKILIVGTDSPYYDLDHPYPGSRPFRP